MGAHAPQQRVALTHCNWRKPSHSDDDPALPKSESRSVVPCPTLWDPMDCSLLVSFVHGILQARILEWVAVPFSRGSSQPRVSNLGLPHCRRILYQLSHQAKNNNKETNKTYILKKGGRETRAWSFLSVSSEDTGRRQPSANQYLTRHLVIRQHLDLGLLSGRTERDTCLLFTLLSL